MARLPLLPFSSMTFGTGVEADLPCTEFLESAMNDATVNELAQYGELNALVTKCSDGTRVLEHKRTSQDKKITWLLKTKIVNAQPPLTSVGYSKVSDECYNIFIFSHGDDTLQIVNWCAHLKYNPAKCGVHVAFLRWGDQMKDCSIRGNILMNWIISMLSNNTCTTPIYTMSLVDCATVTVRSVELNFSLWRGMHQTQRWYESKGFEPKYPDEQETYDKQLSSLQKLTIKELTHILLRLYLVCTYLESNQTDNGLLAGNMLVDGGEPYIKLFQPLIASSFMFTGSMTWSTLKKYKETLFCLLNSFGVNAEDKCEAICYLVGDNKVFTEKLNKILTRIEDASLEKLGKYPRNAKFTQKIYTLQDLRSKSESLTPQEVRFMHDMNELLKLFEMVDVLSVPRELVIESEKKRA